MSIYDFFPDATPEILAPHRHWLDPAAIEPNTNMLVMPIQSYVIRTPQHVVLVDSCVGNHKSVKWFPAWDQMHGNTYLPALAALGLQPQDIDVGLCTHLHVDHSGWNTQWLDGRWRPTFDKARYILSRTEVAACEKLHRERGDPTYVENVLPIIEAAQAVLVDDDHQIDDYVWLEPTPGHTHSHCAVRVDGRGADAVVTGGSHPQSNTVPLPALEFPLRRQQAARRPHPPQISRTLQRLRDPGADRLFPAALGRRSEERRRCLALRLLGQGAFALNSCVVVSVAPDSRAAAVAKPPVHAAPGAVRAPA